MQPRHVKNKTQELHSSCALKARMHFSTQIFRPTHRTAPLVLLVSFKNGHPTHFFHKVPFSTTCILVPSIIFSPPFIGILVYMIPKSNVPKMGPPKEPKLPYGTIMPFSSIIPLPRPPPIVPWIVDCGRHMYFHTYTSKQEYLFLE